MEKATLTVAETAEYIGIGLNKAYKMVNDRTIPSLRIGKQFKIPKTVLDEWLIKQSKTL